MDKSEFRKLIHEECVKAFREEFRDILVEAVEAIEQKKGDTPELCQVRIPSNHVGRSVQTTRTVDPIQAILRETVLSSADRANIGQVGDIEQSTMQSLSIVESAEEYTPVNSVLPPFSKIS